ncbi:MAG: SPFH domain-containing protein [Anaerolineales bacterium]|nr:SPFH domain-containing protein [Anaerolineales bacterium]
MRKLFGGFGSFLQTPYGVVIIVAAVWHGILWGLKIPFNLIVSIVLVVMDFAIAYYLLDRLIYFFSQFVLPIQNQKDRQEIYSRVKIFEFGQRGPTLFVKNGEVIMHEGEAGKRGPGVLVLDTASALVLRTDTEIKGAVGPGIKFTKGNEYVAGSVDLRAQWQFIGPLRSEQPFLNPVPISNPKSYNELHSRRQQTSGMTRDGFEVSPTISIKYSIKRPEKKTPTESGVISHYGFDQRAVRNAITREVIQLGTSENSKTRLEWNKLPEHLVVNIWREYIRKFKLEDLFSGEGKSGLQIIEEMINKRVKQENVEGLDDTGGKTGEWLDSLEFRQLQARGLEIMEVRIHNVLFDPATEEQITNQWNAEWMKIAKKEEKLLNEKEALIETAARNEAIKNFARTATQKFDNPIAPATDPFTTLQDLILPLRETILTESHANREMELELKKLEEVWKWLLVNKFDFRQGQGQENS